MGPKAESVNGRTHKSGCLAGVLLRLVPVQPFPLVYRSIFRVGRLFEIHHAARLSICGAPYHWQHLFRVTLSHFSEWWYHDSNRCS